MLNYSALGPEYWGEAVNCAVYLRNRCPTKALKNKIPQEIWSGRKVKVSHFRIFGCTAYAHVKIRQKLDPKAKKYIMVGYSSNAYRLIDLENPKKVIFAGDIVFNENEFPSKILNVQNGSETEQDESFPLLLDGLVNEPEPNNDPEPPVDIRNISDSFSRIRARSDSDPTIRTDIIHMLSAGDDTFHSLNDSVTNVDTRPRPRRVDRTDYSQFYSAENADDPKLDISTEMPKTVQEALSRPDKAHWRAALNDE